MSETMTLDISLSQPQDATIAMETIAQLDLADKDLFICLDTALNDKTKVRLSDAGTIHVI